MAKRPRRNHGSVFKAKADLKAIKGEQTSVELAERFEVHPQPDSRAEEGSSGESWSEKKWTIA